MPERNACYKGVPSSEQDEYSADHLTFSHVVGTLIMTIIIVDLVPIQEAWEVKKTREKKLHGVE